MQEVTLRAAVFKRPLWGLRQIHAGRYRTQPNPVPVVSSVSLKGGLHLRGTLHLQPTPFSPPVCSFLPQGFLFFFSFPWQQLLGGFTSLTPAVAVHTLKQFLSQATLWNESEKLRCYKHRGAGFLCVSWGMRIQVNPIDLSRRWLNVCLGFGGNQWNA